MSEPIPYDPNCLHCRRDAGRDSAGVTRLCETHKADEIARLQRAEATFHEAYRQRCDAETKALHVEVEGLRAELAEAREKLAEREATVDILVQCVHERDAERDDLRALLTAVAQSGVAWTTRDYVAAQIDKATWDAVQKIGGTR